MALVSAVPELVSDPHAAELALHGLGGLSIEIVHQSIAQGESDVSMLTSMHPAFQRGIDRHGGMVYGLRKQVLPLGWTKFDERLTVSPDGKVAIMFAAGDAATGVEGPDVRPRTKCPKGAQTFDVVVKNQQLSLLPETARRTFPETWVALVARRGNEIAIEVSRPSETADAKNNKVEIINWSKRIIVPSFQLGSPVAEEIIGAQGQDFDVDVKKIN